MIRTVKIGKEKEKYLILNQSTPGKINKTIPWRNHKRWKDQKLFQIFLIWQNYVCIRVFHEKKLLGMGVWHTIFPFCYLGRPRQWLVGYIAKTRNDTTSLKNSVLFWFVFQGRCLVGYMNNILIFTKSLKFDSNVGTSTLIEKAIQQPHFPSHFSFIVLWHLDDNGISYEKVLDPFWRRACHFVCVSVFLCVYAASFPWGKHVSQITLPHGNLSFVFRMLIYLYIITSYACETMFAYGYSPVCHPGVYFSCNTPLDCDFCGILFVIWRTKCFYWYSTSQTTSIPIDPFQICKSFSLFLQHKAVRQDHKVSNF